MTIVTLEMEEALLRVMRGIRDELLWVFPGSASEMLAGLRHQAEDLSNRMIAGDDKPFNDLRVVNRCIDRLVDAMEGA